MFSTVHPPRGSSTKSGKPKVKLEAITKKIHDAIIDWYVHNDVDNIRWKFIENLPKDKVANEMKKSIEEAIWYAMDGPKI